MWQSGLWSQKERSLMVVTFPTKPCPLNRSQVYHPLWLLGPASLAFLFIDSGPNSHTLGRGSTPLQKPVTSASYCSYQQVVLWVEELHGFKSFCRSPGRAILVKGQINRLTYNRTPWSWSTQICLTNPWQGSKGNPMGTEKSCHQVIYSPPKKCKQSPYPFHKN